MLHVFVNDNSAALHRQAGLTGDVSVLSDPMAEGPTPAGIAGHEWRTMRAQFLASFYGRKIVQQIYEWLLTQDQLIEKFVDHDEIVFWLDDSLGDQAIFAYLVDEALQLKIGDTAISRVCLAAVPDLPASAQLAWLTAQQLAALFPTRQRLTRRELVLARQAWAAFRSPDPTVVERMARSDTTALPGIGEALLCRLEQFPARKNGLNRLEEEVIRQAALGATNLGALARGVQARLPRAYPGDVYFARLLEGMAAGRVPALMLTGPTPLPRLDDPPADLDAWSITLTAAAPQLLTGAVDWVQRNGIDRWLGGIHLHGPESPWRWDTERQRLVRQG